jgi:hypothetical protein
MRSGAIMCHSDPEGSILCPNVVRYTPEYTVSHPTRLQPENELL